MCVVAAGGGRKFVSEKWETQVKPREAGSSPPRSPGTARTSKRQGHTASPDSCVSTVFVTSPSVTALQCDLLPFVVVTINANSALLQP